MRQYIYSSYLNLNFTEFISVLDLIVCFEKMSFACQFDSVILTVDRKIFWCVCA